MPGVASATAFDPAELLRAGIAALSAFDVVALERLVEDAEAARAVGARMATTRVDEAIALQDTLSSLLRTTSRSLTMLRRIHGVEEDAWVR